MKNKDKKVMTTYMRVKDWIASFENRFTDPNAWPLTKEEQVFWDALMEQFIQLPLEYRPYATINIYWCWEDIDLLKKQVRDFRARGV